MAGNLKNAGMRKLLLGLVLLSFGVPAAEVPTTLDLDDRKFHLQVFAWRDFMPQIGGDGKGSPLMLTASLVNIAGITSQSAHFDKVLVTCQGQQWQAVPDEGGTARGGPKWEPGSTLMVKAHFSYKGKSQWIQLAKPASVNRTE